MVWAAVFVLVAVVIIMALGSAGSGQVPWIGKMRRVQAGNANGAEWMAPDEVVEQVRADYLAAIQWLQNSQLASWAHQWSGASLHLSGMLLKRHQQILMQYRSGSMPRFVGVLRADHRVEVRHFSDDGERCVVIDHQADRRMATYDPHTQERVMTQDLGAGAVVYQMRYDATDRRWKLEAFVQELPHGWGSGKAVRRLREFSAMPTHTVGRDN